MLTFKDTLKILDPNYRYAKKLTKRQKKRKAELARRTYWLKNNYERSN